MTRHQERNADRFAEYRAWLSRQPCAVCRRPGPSQVAHVGGGGAGLKHGDDDQAIPLCGPHFDPSAEAMPAGCHFEHDNTRGKFERPIWLDKYAWIEIVHAWDARMVEAYQLAFAAHQAPAPGECPF